MWVAVARGIILDSEAGNGLCNGFFMDDIFSPDDALCNMSTSSRAQAWAPISSAELNSNDGKDNIKPPPGVYTN